MKMSIQKCFEDAARLYCKICGIEPDEESLTLKTYIDGCTRPALRWELVAQNLAEKVAMEKAMDLIEKQLEEP